MRDEKFKASIVIDTDSPADKAIKLLNKILEGQEVRPNESDKAFIVLSSLHLYSLQISGCTLATQHACID